MAKIGRNTLRFKFTGRNMSIRRMEEAVYGGPVWL